MAVRLFSPSNSELIGLASPSCFGKIGDGFLIGLSGMGVGGGCFFSIFDSSSASIDWEGVSSFVESGVCILSVSVSAEAFNFFFFFFAVFDFCKTSSLRSPVNCFSGERDGTSSWRGSSTPFLVASGTGISFFSIETTF